MMNVEWAENLGRTPMSNSPGDEGIDRQFEKKDAKPNWPSSRTCEKGNCNKRLKYSRRMFRQMSDTLRNNKKAVWPHLKGINSPYFRQWRLFFHEGYP
jgi:hypothetical protein